MIDHCRFVLPKLKIDPEDLKDGEQPAQVEGQPAAAPAAALPSGRNRRSD